MLLKTLRTVRRTNPIYRDRFKTKDCLAMLMTEQLLKLDPMVRKLETAVREFKEATGNNDLVAAQQLLRQISQTSDFLAEDVTAIYKSEQESNHGIGPNDIYAGGVPVMKFEQKSVPVQQPDILGLVQPHQQPRGFQPQQPSWGNPNRG